MRKICIVLPFICFFFSFTNKEQSVRNLPIVVQKNDKHVNSKLNKKSGNPVFILKVSKNRPLPKKFIINTDLDKVPVIKLQKSDSIIMVKDLLGDLDSKSPETTQYSNTFLLIGGLLFVLVLLFFIVRKKKQSTIKKQLAHDLLAQQHQAEIDAELLEDTDEEIDISDVSEVPTAETIDLYLKLEIYYQNEKPYLNANLKAIDVARALNTSPRTLTAILKANGFNGFNNFNNKYRVDEVIRQFNDPNFSSIKMEAISSNAGFGNRQTFYNAFEEFTGLNPGFYRSEFLKNN
jgi:LPXTG-motif cell wall-anchored protein